MASKRGLDEAAAVLTATLAALETTPRDLDSIDAAELRRQVGEATVNPKATITGGALGETITQSFTLATAAGANPDGLAHVRGVIAAFALTTETSERVRQAFLVACLCAEAAAVAATAFTSKSQTDALLARMQAAFDGAILFASDRLQSTSCRALVALAAVVARDLVARGRTLPQIVIWSFGAARPTLWISNRLYGLASRSDEIIAENHIPHPLFAPPRGAALSR